MVAFTLGVEDVDLAACIDDKINYLTDDQRIGYGEWRQDSSDFYEPGQDVEGSMI